MNLSNNNATVEVKMSPHLQVLIIVRRVHHIGEVHGVATIHVDAVT